MELFKTPHIKFMKYKFIALAVTGIIVLAGVLNVTLGKGLKLGVDFGGGTLIRVMFKEPIAVNKVRQLLGDVGLGNSVIQETGKKGRECLIRTMQVVKAASQQQEMEAHEQLGIKVIGALRGTDGQAEKARGLADLNGLDQKGLAALLEPAFPGKGDENAQKIISFQESERHHRGLYRAPERRDQSRCDQLS